MSFDPPSASQGRLQGIDFQSASPVAADIKAAFDADDQRPGNRDPNLCKALLRFPNGAVFWSSKMAIDADGPAAGPGRLSGTELDPDSGPRRDGVQLPRSGGGHLIGSCAYRKSHPGWRRRNNAVALAG